MSSPRGSAAVGGAAPPRRVLFALSGLHRVARGAEVAFESLATALAALPGYDVTLIGTGPPRPDRPYRFKKVPCLPREWFSAIRPIPLLRSHYAYEELTYVPGLLSSVAFERYDVTCTCSYPFTNWALRAMMRGRSAHVFVTQNGDWPARTQTREYRFFACDGLVCINPEYLERNRDRWRCSLIPNGVALDRFFPGVTSRAQFGIPEGVPVALVVSALIPSKRVLEAIRCVAQVPGLHLVVAGDGDLREEVDALGVKALSNRYRRLTLPHATMPELYRAADVLLHMSRDEPFGNVYVEALATGLPVVAHDNASSRWILGSHGTLVDTSDDAAVAAALVAALRVGPAGAADRRAYAQRTYGWPAVARRYAAFFDEVLEQGSFGRAIEAPARSREPY